MHWKDHLQQRRGHINSLHKDFNNILSLPHTLGFGCLKMSLNWFLSSVNCWNSLSSSDCAEAEVIRSFTISSFKNCLTCLGKQM